MTDKPKTLHEQLTELAEWLDEEGGMWGADGLHVIAAEFSTKAAEVRTMAERVADCVIVKPFVTQVGAYEWAAGMNARHVTAGFGGTKDEALANLQAILDKED